MKACIAMLAALTLTGLLAGCAAKEPPQPAGSSAESSTEQTARTENTAESSVLTEADSAAADDFADVLGTWIVQDENPPSEYVFAGKNEAYCKTGLDVTDTFHFDENRRFISKDIPIPEDDIFFAGGVFVFTYKDHTALEMEKTDGSDHVFGEYRLTGGEYMEKLLAKLRDPEDDREWVEFETDRITLEFSENETVLFLADRIDGFELKPDVMITDLDGDGNTKETPYQIAGDTMTLRPAENEEVILIRKTGS